MPDKKPALDYKEQLRRFAEQGNVEVLKGELASLKKERRYLPVCEPLMTEVKQFIETAKERKKDIAHHQARIELSIKDDEEDRKRIQRQQEEEEQRKPLHEARKKYLSLMEKLEKIFAETREERVGALLENKKTKECIDQLLVNVNAERPEDDQVSQEMLMRELVLRGDEAMKTVFADILDKKPDLALDEVVPEANRLIKEHQDDLWLAFLPKPTPSNIFILNQDHFHHFSEDLKPIVGRILSAGMAMVIVPEQNILDAQKQQMVIRLMIERALQEENHSAFSATSTRRLRPY